MTVYFVYLAFINMIIIINIRDFVLYISDGHNKTVYTIIKQLSNIYKLKTSIKIDRYLDSRINIK